MTTAAPNVAAAKFEILSVEALLALPDLEWLIDGILPKPGVAILYGEPGCGKTFAALSMALTCAAGQDWLGRKTCPAKILYIAGEGAHGLKTRVAAHAKKFGLRAENVRFVVRAIDFGDARAVALLHEELKDGDFIPDMIIIDTFARASPGVDENSARDVGRVIEVIDCLKAETEATILVLHHTRKDGGSERGSSALRGAADVMIKCEKVGAPPVEGIEITCDKMKDGPEFPPIAAHLEVVKLEVGGSSLVLGRLMDCLRADNGHAETFRKLLGGQFAEKGASTGELKDAFMAELKCSKSTFDRALREIRKTSLLVERDVDGKKRYFLGEVSGVTAVSEGVMTHA